MKHSVIHRSYRSRKSIGVLTSFAWRMFGFGLVFGGAIVWALYQVFLSTETASR